MNELLQTVATKGGPLTSRHCGGMSEGLSALGVAGAAISPSRLMNSEGLSGPVNIANSNEFTIRELAEMVTPLTGSRSEIVRRPLPAGRPRSTPAGYLPGRKKARLAARRISREGLARISRGPRPTQAGAVGDFTCRNRPNRCAARRVGDRR